MKTNKIAKTMEKLGRISAVKASGTASGFGTYQPKEPKAVKLIAKQKDSK